MEVLMLTADREPELVLPALDLLAHTVRVGPLVVSALAAASSCDLVVVDARTDPAAARSVCQLIGGAALGIPVMALLTEDALVSIHPGLEPRRRPAQPNRARRTRRPPAPIGGPAPARPHRRQPRTTDPR